MVTVAQLVEHWTVTPVVAGRVDALIGNDHHLLDLAGESSVPILRPGEFLRSSDGEAIKDIA